MNEWEFNLLEDKPSLESVTIVGVEVKIGERVRLRPRDGGDVMDIALAGKIATVESIEQDYEGRIHLAVVVDDDPGRDIGMMRQPGHRFFFSSTEVEPVEQELSRADALAAATATAASAGDAARKTPSILIAGIGNIFLGDDAFGVEVVKRFAGRELPEGVHVIDFGIRGFDLTYALIDGADVTILVDACPRGGAAGDLYVVEPDLNSKDATETAPAAVDAHGMNPMAVIRTAQAMGGTAALKKILVLGCEPETFGPEEGQMGLSEPVALAVERAIPLLDSLVHRILNGDSQLDPA
jgi:hydrogenase maturation protease